MTQSLPVAEERVGEAWHNRSTEDVPAQLGTSVTGVTSQEATQRLTADGANEPIEGMRISPLQIFLGQCNSLIIWILIAAGVLSGVLGDRVDAIAILTIVILNAVIGFYQEYHAEKSIAALKCIESALTGKSEGVTKQSATLEQGELPLGDRETWCSLAQAWRPARDRPLWWPRDEDELSRIAGLIGVAASEKGTPRQRKLDSVGRIIVWAALGVVALIARVCVFATYDRGRDSTKLSDEI